MKRQKQRVYPAWAPAIKESLGKWINEEEINVATPHGTYRVKIETDTDPQNPRTDWDPFGHMICYHGKYTLGDKNETGMDAKEFREWVQKDKSVALYLTIWMLDHSGITISTGPFASDPQGWDSGVVGFIYSTYEDIRKEYKVKKVSSQLLEKVKLLLKAEIKTYDTYLRGDIYCVKVYSPSDDDDDFESCCGFYGTDPDGVYDYIVEAIEGDIKTKSEVNSRHVQKHEKVVASYVKNNVPIDKRQPMELPYPGYPVAKKEKEVAHG